MPCAMANENVKPAQKALLIKMLTRGVRLVLMIMEGQRSYACEWAPLDALVSSGTLEETIFKMHTSASYTTQNCGYRFSMRPCRARARMHVNLQKIPQWLYNWDMLVDVMRGCLNKKKDFWWYTLDKKDVLNCSNIIVDTFFIVGSEGSFFLVHSEFKASLNFGFWSKVYWSFSKWKHNFKFY